MATWRRLAEIRGGSVLQFARAPDGSIVAATPIGLFRSADSGRTWSSLGTPTAAATINCVGAAPDGVVFAGTSHGLFRSTDGGQSWRPVLSGGAVVSVAAEHGGIVLVGTANDGLLRSEDGGLRWNGANAGLMELSVQVVAASPTFADDGMALAGTTAGLFLSRNGGRSWREVDVDGAAVQCVAFGPGGRVGIGTEDDGVMLSADRGATWRPAGLAGASVTAVAFVESGQRLLAATGRELRETDDDGRNWRLITTAAAPILSICAGDDATFVGLAGRGVMRLGDGAGDANLAAAAPRFLALSPRFDVDRTLFVATDDGLLYRSTDAGESLEPVELALREPVVTGMRATSVEGRHRVWIGSIGALYRVDPDVGHAELVDLPIPDDDPVVFDGGAEESGLLAAVGSAMLRGVENGTHWEVIGRVPSGATIVALAAGGSRAVFAATSDGTVWRVSNRASKWESLLETPGEVASAIVAWDDPSDLGVAVALGSTVAVPMPKTREQRGGRSRPLWRRTELGPHAPSISDLALCGSRVGRTSMVVATDAGLYYSVNHGLSFCKAGLDGIQIAAVVGDHDHVCVSALGGQLWAGHLFAPTDK